MSEAVTEPVYPLPPAGFNMRMMTADDLAQVIAIEREAQLTPWGEQSFLDAIVANDILPVVLHQDQVVAYGVLKMMWEEAEILNLVVAQEWRRHGLGRFLVRHLVRSAGLNGAQKVFLEVRESNTGAQKLYEQEDFSIFGKRIGYYETEDGREDALLMRWVHNDEA